MKKTSKKVKKQLKKKPASDHESFVLLDDACAIILQNTDMMIELLHQISICGECAKEITSK